MYIPGISNRRDFPGISYVYARHITLVYALHIPFIYRYIVLCTFYIQVYVPGILSTVTVYDVLSIY
jgi:hypothetical protein